MRSLQILPHELNPGLQSESTAIREYMRLSLARIEVAEITVIEVGEVDLYFIRGRHTD
jgi:hypothetical protein